MSRVRVHGFTLSIDGFGAGPGQNEQHPLGVGGHALHSWLVSTRTFHQMIGEAGGSTGIDDAFAVAGSEGIGATIMGRNMFGPVRGPWPDASWKGWWGPDPPYHTPVFVLTHHAREPLAMAGGTTFHFVTGAIEAALARAREAAGALDVRIGGGVSTIRQYLAAGLVDEMHLAISPVLLGTGEHLLAGLDLARLGFERTRHESTPNALHVVLTKPEH
jgi:dihydrofolate reductase